MESESPSEQQDEYNSLVTQAKFHSRVQIDLSVSTPLRKGRINRTGKKSAMCRTL